MSFTSDEVNFLVYRYLQESGFFHSAYTFGKWSLSYLKASISRLMNEENIDRRRQLCHWRQCRACSMPSLCALTGIHLKPQWLSSRWTGQEFRLLDNWVLTARWLTSNQDSRDANLYLESRLAQILCCSWALTRKDLPEMLEKINFHFTAEIDL